jgi:hypothetical protein
MCIAERTSPYTQHVDLSLWSAAAAQLPSSIKSAHFQVRLPPMADYSPSFHPSTLLTIWVLHTTFHTTYPALKRLTLWGLKKICIFIYRGQAAVTKLNSILWDHDVTPKTKTHIYHAVVKSSNYICSRNMVFKSKNGIKTEFHRNGLLAMIGSNFQEGQN